MVLVVRYNMNPTIFKLDYHTKEENLPNLEKIKETIKSISNIGSTVYEGYIKLHGEGRKKFQADSASFHSN